MRRRATKKAAAAVISSGLVLRMAIVLLLSADAIEALLLYTSPQTRYTRHGSRLYSFTPPPPLIPEENPALAVDSTTTSAAGVSYKSVLDRLHQLFPPSDLEKRNALSRTDGYWPFIQQGEDPPSHLTYGEFDFYFFAQLLDKAMEQLQRPPKQQPKQQDVVFCDVGSGTGRLVLAAAMLHPNWKTCRGIELLPTIHANAMENLQTCQEALVVNDDDNTNTNTNDGPSIMMAPVELLCGSFTDPYMYLGDADIIFVFSACMGNGPLPSLTKNIGRQCQPGTIVITTEFMLPLSGEIEPVDNDDRLAHGSFELELVEKVDGWCWLTGGESTAFIHRVKTSLWTPEQQALR